MTSLHGQLKSVPRSERFREEKGFREAKTETFPDHIYPRTIIFSRQMEVIVLIILQILFETRAFLKIWEYHSGVSQLLGNIQSHFMPITR